MFVERKFQANGNEDKLYGSPDTLISKDDPRLHVENFSQSPVTISAGQILGTARNPKGWLDRMDKFSKEDQTQIDAHATLIRTLAHVHFHGDCETNVVRSETKISSKAQRNATEENDPLAEDPIEGGAKTSEVPEDSIPGGAILSEVDISPHLTSEECQELQTVILRNKLAFGTDGRLGNYKVEVEIPMKPDSEPVSLPPFPVSPANREVI
ncbi:hypothetical protein K438DRAFT_1605075, partial [Mycena galopus ATCC 62051]